MINRRVNYSIITRRQGRKPREGYTLFRSLTKSTTKFRSHFIALIFITRLLKAIYNNGIGFGLVNYPYKKGLISSSLIIQPL